jgi:pSer/pThr/pTyr-binding forkhead associated (FHA) protein
MPTFTISVSNKVLGTYVVKKPLISLGRSRTNTISIASKAISRNHVRIELTPSGWTVTDLGSLNGSFLNDIRITSASLSPGDKITVGAYNISFSPEPVYTGEESEQTPAIAAEETESSDVDMRMDNVPVPPDTKVGIPPVAPPKQAHDTAVVAEPAAGDTGTAPASSQQPVVEEVTERHPGLEPQESSAQEPADQGKETRQKKERRIWESGKLSDLQTEDKIRAVIFEDPLAEDTEIRDYLSESDSGDVKLSAAELKRVLRQLDLDTRFKRYRFFMHS